MPVEQQKLNETAAAKFQRYYASFRGVKPAQNSPKKEGSSKIQPVSGKNYDAPVASRLFISGMSVREVHSSMN